MFLRSSTQLVTGFLGLVRRPHARCMNTRSLIAGLTFAALAMASAASASDSALQPDVGAQFLAALDGTVVQIAGNAPNYTLAQHNPDGTVVPVAGAPQALYRSVDLGHDAAGRLVLTYIRCSDNTNCKAYSDDLAGHRVSYKRLTPRRCTLTTAPARWGSRVAYGQTCTKLRGKPGVWDAKRSGLYVRSGAGVAKRLRMSAGSSGYVDRVDLRRTTVAAVSPGNQSYAFSQSVNAKNLRSTLITVNTAYISIFDQGTCKRTCDSKIKVGTKIKPCETYTFKICCPKPLPAKHIVNVRINHSLGHNEQWYFRP